MYSDCSNQYWKKRSKPHLTFKAKVSLAIFVTLVFFMLISHSHRKRQYKEIQRQLLLKEQKKTIRPEPTKEHYQLCDANMRDNVKMECSKLCHDEIVSIPRPTMYDSCIHGCSRSIYSAAMIGCRMGSIEEAFQEESREQAINSCSRYQFVEPQPFVLSTCRKYYREGTKAGRNLGYEFINRLVDAHWERIRNEI